jgi:hypothetical protein
MSDPNAILTKQEEDILKLIRHIETRRIKRNDDSEQEVINIDSNDAGLELPQAPKKEGQRRGDRLQHCRKVIERWRSQCWHQHYEGSAWGPRALMSDPIVTKLATHTHIKTLENLRMEVPEWDFALRHGTDVLAIIRDADSRYKQQNLRENSQTNRRTEKQKSNPKPRPVLQPVPQPLPQLHFPQLIPQAVPQPIPQPMHGPVYAYPPQYAMYPPVPFPGYAPPPGYMPPPGAWIAYPFPPPLQYSGPHSQPHSQRH